MQYMSKVESHLNEKLHLQYLIARMLKEIHFTLICNKWNQINVEPEWKNKNFAVKMHKIY